MDRFGFIHEKLDIKILILFVLNRLPGPVSFETLSDLVMVDDGFDYFEFSQCLAELVKTGQVGQDENSYRITKLGAENGDAVESSIPYSVRAKAERRAQPLAAEMKRDMQILTSHEKPRGGGCKVSLSLSDGIGNVIAMSVLASDEAQAEIMEKTFRADAESIYHKVVRLLTNQDKGTEEI
ncbi:MAG: DUF4364 family protein [Oscillospiraceae bacterium]|jgi:hypothetical protein|nr:DUF4364 family protein [Oscillospiraceae bacterium]